MAGRDGSARKAAPTAKEVARMAAARIAVAHRATNQAAKLYPGCNGGTLRVLLAFWAASDEAGRFTTAQGENTLFESKTYYQHVLALEEAGLIRRLPRRQRTRRHCEVTAPGQKAAAKVARLVEAAAREFIEGSRFTE